MKIPTVTAIVPAYNCEDTIKSCISSLISLRGDYIGDFEILVVYDESSNDATKRELDIFKERIRIVKVKNFNLSQARNFGAKKAKGEVLFFVDADTIYDINFLRLVVSRLKNCNAVMGAKFVYNPDSFYKKLKNLDLSVRMRGDYKIFALSTGWVIWKSDFKKLGGYNESLEYGVPEDVDIFKKMHEMGFIICFEPSARFYEIEKGIIADLKKHYRSGKHYAKADLKLQIKRSLTAGYLFLLPFFIILSIFYSKFLVIYLIPFITNFIKTYNNSKLTLSSVPLLLLYKLISPIFATSLIAGYLLQIFKKVWNKIK